MYNLWLRTAATALFLITTAGAGHVQAQQSVQPSRLIIRVSPRPTPFVVGGVRLDPERLTAPSGPARRSGVVLAGTADHAETATLASELRLRDALGRSVAAPGTPLFRVEFAKGDTATSVWCGNLGRKGLFGTPGPVLCMFGTAPADQAFMSLAARPWLMTSERAQPSPLHYEGLQLTPSPTDLFGPMDVRVMVSRVRPTDVDLALIASREGDDMVVMRFSLPVVDGRAVMPLWSHRLVLTVVGDSVTPTLSADGDGVGPQSLGGYPAN